MHSTASNNQLSDPPGAAHVSIASTHHAQSLLGTMNSLHESASRGRKLSEHFYSAEVEPGVAMLVEIVNGDPFVFILPNQIWHFESEPGSGTDKLRQRINAKVFFCAVVDAARSTKNQAPQDQTSQSQASKAKDAYLDRKTRFLPSFGLGNSTTRESMRLAVQQERAVAAVELYDYGAKRRDLGLIEMAERDIQYRGFSETPDADIQRATERIKADTYTKTEYRVYAGFDNQGPFLTLNKAEFEYVQELKAQALKTQEQTKADSGGESGLSRDFDGQDRHGPSGGKAGGDKARGPGFEYVYDRIDDTLYNLAQTFKQGKPLHWPVVTKAQISKVWGSFVECGCVRDEQALQSIQESICDSLVHLHVATIAAGHTQQSVESFLEDHLEPDQWEPFTDWLIEDEAGGHWRISDYGIKPLTEAVALAFEAKSLSAKLKFLDRALHVAHMRGDLSRLFVEGGRDTMLDVDCLEAPVGAESQESQKLQAHEAPASSRRRMRM